MTTTVAAPLAEPIPITQYEKLRTEIALAKQESAAAVFQYRDPKGNKAARSYVFKLRSLKGEIDRARKEAKASALEFGRRVDSTASEMVGQVEALIKPHQEAIESIDNEEVQRKAGHSAVIFRIAAMRNWTELHDSKTIAGELASLKALSTDGLDEFKAQADAEIISSLRHLELALSGSIKRERDAAELDRLRAESAARAESDRIARLQADAVEAERTRAAREAAAADALVKAEQDRKDREARDAATASARREQDAKDAAERAEKDRAAAVQRAELAERNAKIAAEVRARELAEAEARKAARLKAEAENRAAMIDQIAADLARLKAEGVITSHKALAELIVAGRIRNVVVEWGGK